MTSDHALPLGKRRNLSAPIVSADAYYRSPGDNKTLLTLYGAEHMMGGVSGYDADETTDENPERVAAVRALIWAYLRTALNPGDPAWKDATAALAAQPEPCGRIETSADAT